MIAFLLGTLFGGPVGLVAACLCIAAGRADRSLLPENEERPMTGRSDSDAI